MQCNLEQSTSLHHVLEERSVTVTNVRTSNSHSSYCLYGYVTVLYQLLRKTIDMSDRRTNVLCWIQTKVPCAICYCISYAAQYAGLERIQC